MKIQLHSIPATDTGLQAALSSDGLPIDDLGEKGREFFACDVDGRTVGYCGLEALGDAALLRSMVVLPNCRGRGIGLQIPGPVLGHARRAGVCNVYLLTTSAAAFFEKAGFARIDRRQAPEEVRLTRQASSLCPSSATLLKITLPEFYD